MIDVRRGQVFVMGIRLDGSYGEIDVLDLDDVSFRVWVIHRLIELRPTYQSLFSGGRGPTLEFRQHNPEILRERRPDQRFGRPGAANHGEEAQENHPGEEAQDGPASA